MRSRFRSEIAELTAPWKKTFIGKGTVLAESNFCWRPIGIVRGGRMVPLPLPPDEPDLSLDEMIDLRKDEIRAKRHTDDEIRAQVWREEARFAFFFWGLILLATIAVFW